MSQPRHISHDLWSAVIDVNHTKATFSDDKRKGLLIITSLNEGPPVQDSSWNTDRHDPFGLLYRNRGALSIGSSH